MRAPLALCLALAAGCALHPAAAAAQQDAVPWAHTADTTLVVAGPTLIALFPDVSQAEVDADPYLTEALADFQWFLPRALGPLSAAGIATHEVYADILRLRDAADPSRVFTFDARQVRYVWMGPGREPRAIDTVMQDPGLLEISAEYFSRPELRAPDN